MGCGDDETPTPDAGPLPVDMGPPDPVAIAVCERADLVIASLDLSTATLTLLNPTGADITVDASSAYQLCQGPGAYARLPAPSPVTITAGGTADFDLSGVADITIDATNGALALYNSSSFFTRDAMLDYLCWGDGGGTPRIDVARRLGTDMSVLWGDGACVDLGGGAALHRTPGSDGSAAADYTTTSQTLICN